MSDELHRLRVAVEAVRCLADGYERHGDPAVARELREVTGRAGAADGFWGRSAARLQTKVAELQAQLATAERCNASLIPGAMVTATEVECLRAERDSLKARLAYGEELALARDAHELAMRDERDFLKAKLAEAEGRLKFTHPVFNGAKGAPAHYETDGALPGDPHDVYRIVLDEVADRWRDEYRTTARPPYIATVYSLDYAVMFAWAVSNLENWIRHGNRVEAERDAAAQRAEDACRIAAEQWPELRKITAADTERRVVEEIAEWLERNTSMTPGEHKQFRAGAYRKQGGRDE